MLGIEYSIVVVGLKGFGKFCFNSKYFEMIDSALSTDVGISTIDSIESMLFTWFESISVANTLAKFLIDPTELAITVIVTIAGQTAPGDGITLKNDPSNLDSPLVVETGEVIIRYVRFRPGASTELSDNLRALTIGGWKKYYY